MPIIVRLDKIMAERKISSNELAERIGTTPVNLSRIKKGIFAAFASTHSSSYASPFVANPETFSKS